MLFAIKFLEAQKSEVLNHWISFADGFTYPPQDFYARVEQEIAARQIPSLDISRVEFAEGGWLSGRRIYLRLMRERLAFDACAAPLGNLFFFSCRTVHLPPVLKLWHLLCLAGFFGLVFLGLFQLLGLIEGAVMTCGLALAILMVFQNAVGDGLSDLDRLLLRIPALGIIYEKFFRKETYYREDTRLVYLKILPELIKTLAEEVTAAQGVKLTEQYRRAPILGELYKREPQTPQP